jgi:hypothetical protein
MNLMNLGSQNRIFATLVSSLMTFQVSGSPLSELQHLIWNSFVVVEDLC